MKSMDMFGERTADVRDMIIIGWESKGNVVRFYLANKGIDYWSGDDWDDAPYEHNACTCPLFGTDAWLEVAFSYKVSVLEPENDWNYGGNSPFCMNDFKERKAPFMVIDSTGEERWYSQAVNNFDKFAIYMGDLAEIDWDKIGGTVIGFEDYRD